jgi:hypothetical protein
MTPANAPVDANLPVDILESRAEAQRAKLHHDVEELRTTVRQTLDKKKLAQQYLAPTVGVTAIFALVLGYTVTGVFTRD